MLNQRSEQFEYSIDIASFRIYAIEVISLPLTITFLSFVFAAFIFAVASQSIHGAELLAKKGGYIFGLGFIFLLISLFSILAQISLVIALIAIGFTIVLFLYWTHGGYWGHPKHLSSSNTNT